MDIVYNMIHCTYVVDCTDTYILGKSCILGFTKLLHVLLVNMDTYTNAVIHGWLAFVTRSMKRGLIAF